MTVIGFDFGTTNSLISVISGDRAINLLDRNALPVPSVVSYEGAKTVVGREAKERLDSAGIGIHGNIIRSPKFLLGDESVFVGGVERSPIDVVHDVVAFVKEEALRSEVQIDLDDASKAVVTIPVNMNGRRRAALRDAFRKAGISIVQFIHEPFAALYGFFRSADHMEDALREYDRKYVLVVDWGGGTLDLNLCLFDSGNVTQLRNHGTADVGGDRFDEAVRNEVVRAFCAEHDVAADLEIHPDAHTRLLHQCERAKIDLSRRSSAVLYVPSFFRESDLPLDYRLDRESLEAMARPILDNGLSRIHVLLEEAKIAPAQISLCLATGGMVNMPAVTSRLHELFGPQRVKVTDRSATLIAEGAAWVAHDRRPLHLAKTVELRLARNSYLPLVRAGTAMPTEGLVLKDEVHLYCADPRDGAAKFQFCSPERPGQDVLISEPRVPLGDTMVRVHSGAKPFRERLELALQINDDLILKASAMSLEARDRAEVAIHDLEFGLRFPHDEALREDTEWFHPVHMATEPGHQAGDLVVRSNVTATEDKSLIPGEYMYEVDPGYMDPRRRPPQEQVEEFLYYRPCAVCGRSSSDPGCRCASGTRSA